MCRPNGYCLWETAHALHAKDSERGSMLPELAHQRPPRPSSGARRPGAWSRWTRQRPSSAEATPAQMLMPLRLLPCEIATCKSRLGRIINATGDYPSPWPASARQQRSTNSMARSRKLLACISTSSNVVPPLLQLRKPSRTRAGDHVKHMNSDSTRQMTSKVRLPGQQYMILRDAVHEKAELTSLT